ncbi:hypothetical protein C8R47DRAFT_1284644 [Mycena vitilis]|nr:hypothetical protein C8R47DRAFT_1284644 [Mycena vitilis]
MSGKDASAPVFFLLIIISYHSATNSRLSAFLLGELAPPILSRDPRGSLIPYHHVRGFSHAFSWARKERAIAPKAIALPGPVPRCRSSSRQPPVAPPDAHTGCAAFVVPQDPVTWQRQASPAGPLGNRRPPTRAMPREEMTAPSRLVNPGTPATLDLPATHGFVQPYPSFASSPLSASALGRLSETVFGNPSRDFTLVDNPDAPIERQAGYSYPQSVGRGVGLLVLFEGVFGGPYSDRDRRSTTLEGAEGRRYLGRRGKGGLAQRSPYLLQIGAIGGVGKEFLSPCMPFEIRLSGFLDNPGVIVRITQTFHDSPGGAGPRNKEFRGFVITRTAWWMARRKGKKGSMRWIMTSPPLFKVDVLSDLVVVQ